MYAVDPQYPVWRQIPLLVSINKWISRCDTYLDMLGAFLIAFIMFFTTAGILARYLFNSPIYGKVEITELIMAGVVFFGAAYTQKLGGHIRMSFVVERYLKGRALHVVEAFTLLLSLLGFILITITTFQSALYDFQFQGYTPNLYLPVWPSKMCVPLGTFFLCIRLAVQLTQHLLQAVVGQEQREL